MTASSSKSAGKLQPGSPTNPVEFGKYFLHGLIARGGMAEVYRARLRDSQAEAKLLAIKVMRPDLAREARFIDMFHREGQLALLLKGRSIVETMELGEISGRHYIAMEFIGGRDLTQVLRRCQKSNLRIPVPHAVFIASRIAEGLDLAHRLVGPDGRPLNLVNRDVSPSNVRMSYDGEVKLLDFGIAQALMKFTSEIGVLKGKFSYMSPEQIRGMPVDARTDIFSAGIILHEMLTTEKLFRGDTEFALMEKVRKAEIQPPSKFNRRVSPELDRIVLKALARDVRDRYQTAAEMHQDLIAILEGYRFDVRELRDFIRKEFRREYAKELEDMQTALASNPEVESLPMYSTAEEPITSVTKPRTPVPGEPPQDREPGVVAVAQGPIGGVPAQAATEPPPSIGDKPKGFWSRFRKRRK